MNIYFYFCKLLKKCFLHFLISIRNTSEGEQRVIVTPWYRVTLHATITHSCTLILYTQVTHFKLRVTLEHLRRTTTVIGGNPRLTSLHHPFLRLCFDARFNEQTINKYHPIKLVVTEMEPYCFCGQLWPITAVLI